MCCFYHEIWPSESPDFHYPLSISMACNPPSQHQHDFRGKWPLCEYGPLSFQDWLSAPWNRFYFWDSAGGMSIISLKIIPYFIFLLTVPGGSSVSYVELQSSNHFKCAEVFVFSTVYFFLRLFLSCGACLHLHTWLLWSSTAQRTQYLIVNL